jgi:DNA primase
MNVLDDLKKLEASIVKRYQELQPALAEIEELRRVAERLGVNLDRASTRAAKPATAAATRTRTRTRTRRAPSAGRKTKVSSPRRPRAGGRREQVLKLVTERPGITVPEIGKALKVDPTGLYRYAKQLEADGSITKSGTKLSPAGS